MESKMCRQDVALEMLKAQPRKGGLSTGQIKLAEAQAADFKSQKGEIKMLGERMTNVEKRLETLENTVVTGFAEIKKILEENKKPRTLFEKIVALQDHKYFWITTIIGILVLAGLLGVPLTEFKGVFGIFGGQ